MTASPLRWTREEMEKLAQATATTLASKEGQSLSFKHAAERSQGVLAKERQRSEIVSSTTLASLKRRVKAIRGTTKGAKAHATSNTESSSSKGNSEDAKLAYALGHVQSWIETYARSIGLPATSVAYRLGKLLQRSARR